MYLFVASWLDEIGFISNISLQVTPKPFPSIVSALTFIENQPTLEDPTVGCDSEVGTVVDFFLVGTFSQLVVGEI